MIVRVSGADAHRVAQSIVAELLGSGAARFCELRFADLVVPAWIYFFAQGRSYTGETLVEFQIPGNPLLARMLLDAIIAAGARHAEPGEFTARAYFSGRIDLTEAEGVAATIAANGEHELRAARQLMVGELSRRLKPSIDALAETLALVEAGIDFSDEGISFVATEQIERRAQEVDTALALLLEDSAKFEPLTHEPTFVLIGRPNAGKSTLLNALSRSERAVVSPVAGTTRDALSAEVRLRRGMVRVIDVAGLDRCGGIPDVPTGAVAYMSRMMHEKALRALDSADRVIHVRDLSDDADPLAVGRQADLTVWTKADLVDINETRALSSEPKQLRVSAVSGIGMDELRDAMDRSAFGDQAGGNSFALNARHRHAIGEAQQALARARQLVRNGDGAELVAMELREALNALGQVLGQVMPDEVLGRVFATFCIGK